VGHFDFHSGSRKAVGSHYREIQQGQKHRGRYPLPADCRISDLLSEAFWISANEREDL